MFACYAGIFRFCMEDCSGISLQYSLIRMKNVDVYVTGSNARFLSKDVITELLKNAGCQ